MLRQAGRMSRMSWRKTISCFVCSILWKKREDSGEIFLINFDTVDNVGLRNTIWEVLNSMLSSGDTGEKIDLSVSL